MLKLCKPVSLFFIVAVIAACASCAGRSLGGGMRSERVADEQAALSPAAESMRRRDAAGAMSRNAMEGDRESSDDAPASGQPTEPERRRMVIYDGRFRISVESVKNTVKEVESIVGRYNGFLQSVNTSDSYRRAKIVLRIPVDKFDAATRDVEKLGRVLHKQVSASDVTMQFHDTSLRLKTAERVRERLYQLLRRVDKVKERVKVLQEIARLNTIIDSYTAQISYLRDRASFSTISLDLQAIVRDISGQYITSPFRWIANLNPRQRSIFEMDSNISYTNPKGFFLLKEEFNERRGQYLFQNPSRTVSMRIGSVENYPPADKKFWQEAFAIDLENRKYRVAEKGNVEGRNGLTFNTCRIKLGDASSYIAAFGVAGNKIVVFEARVDNDEVYKKNKEVIEKFLGTVGYEK